MQLSDLPLGAKAGFMDRELRPGNDWPWGLAQALATCRVFVPLYSRRYFESEHCGKEWFAFSRRALNHAARGAGRVEAIIPALWVPVEPRLLPEAARSIHFDHKSLGERYAAHGFYGIIKLSRYRDAYEEAVYELARRIVDVAQRSVIEPESAVDYDSLESAFGVDSRSMPGDQRLRITIVAPRRDELPAGRGAFHYGPTARDWNPYRPDSVRVLADHTADLVRSLGYRPDVGDLFQHGETLLSGGPPAGPEVLIVDAWAVTQTDCHEMLRRLDSMDKPWVQVMIPWNRRDSENSEAENKLRMALDSALGRKLAEGRATSSVAVRGVPSLEDFSMVLPTVIRAAVRQYLRHARAFPPVGPVMERPRLSGPMADPSNPLERSDG